MSSSTTNQTSATPEGLLLDAIEKGFPLVLLVGQDAWMDVDNRDAVLQLAINQVGASPIAQDGWKNVLSITQIPDDFYSWLAERFGRRRAPPWFDAVARLPWSAIFTSSLDPTLNETFTTPIP